MSTSSTFSGVKFSVLIFASILFLITAGGILISAGFGLVQIESPGFINVASVIGFIVLCFLGLTSYRIYFFLLPFVMLAYPAAANDFFPSAYLGLSDESGASLFPFFTHIDIFLSLGIFKKAIDQRGVLLLQVNKLTLVVICLFLLSTIVNIIFVRDAHQFALLICGLFPLRFILLLLILISNHEIEKYERPIISGIIFSVFFLLLESSINTYISQTDMLNSGTLASNTFANITAAILVFVVYLKRQKYPLNYFLYIAILVTGATIVILTETRMAIAAGVGAFFLIQTSLFKWYKTLLVVLTLGVLIIVAYNLIEVPDRYSVKFLLSRIQFNGFSTDLSQMVTIEHSWETSSIITRLKLFQTSINMFASDPLFGTGYGTFNYLKNDFGFDVYVLIDAHNGYLNTIAQMGLSSVFFLFFIYVYPFFNFKSIKTASYLKYLFVINLTMAIADLTNAGIYKYSVFALLAFNSIVLMALSRSSRLNQSKSEP